MLTHDLHNHSIRSPCGTMTYGEIVNAAADLGIRTVAITDHGLGMGLNRFTFHILAKRFPAEHLGVRIYKGIEANVLDADGTVDVPQELLTWFDYIALGLHPIQGLWPDRGLEANTDTLIAALRRNPWIDAIAHPTQRSHPLDPARLLPVMAELGVAFEVNECSHLYDKADAEVTAAWLQQAVELGAPVVTNSDAHVITEMGQDEHIRGVLYRAGLDFDIAVNATEDSVLSFVAGRREMRQRWVADNPLPPPPPVVPNPGR
jgi:putative hydrolase